MAAAEQQLEHRLKQLLPAANGYIEVDETVTTELQQTIARVDPSILSLQERPLDAAAVQRRLAALDTALAEMGTVAVLLGRWGNDHHMPSLQRIFGRLCDTSEAASGLNGWVALAWFPFVALSYYAGIAALSGERYDVLAAMRRSRRGVRTRHEEHTEAFVAAVRALSNSAPHDVFKLLPGYERRFTAMNDYIFEYVRAKLTSTLHIGPEFEDLFDRFEIIQTISYLSDRDEEGGWAPPGRFAWKYGGGASRSAYVQFEAEAAVMGQNWEPALAGLFRGSTDRFLQLAKRYREDVLNRSNWR